MTNIAAVGIATCDSQSRIIEVYYLKPVILSGAEVEANGIISSATKFTNSELNRALQQLCEHKHLVFCQIATNKAPTSIVEAYLQLHALSHRIVKPQQLNLQGIFGQLHNLVWTNQGPMTLADFEANQLLFRQKRQWLQVYSVDKFPQMANYVIPSGVRIADTARVRLGAYLGEGTTIMHEGFVNFNAGSEGPNMVEGRISAGVFVGSGSDLGGGCSTMGTLSGGGNQIIAVGKNCLIGANAGIGISLGDNCTVEAGLYITAGMKVSVIGDGQNMQCKALQLSGRDHLLFRRNSQSGAVECIVDAGNAVALNAELHNN